MKVTVADWMNESARALSGIVVSVSATADPAESYQILIER